MAKYVFLSSLAVAEQYGLHNSGYVNTVVERGNPKVIVAYEKGHTYTQGEPIQFAQNMKKYVLVFDVEIDEGSEANFSDQDEVVIIALNPSAAKALAKEKYTGDYEMYQETTHRRALKV